MERICYRPGYKYQLRETYVTQIELKPDQPIDTPYIKLATNGRLEIREGYAWDGPSGPTLDTLDSMRASLVHDALYQLMRMNLLNKASHRKRADRIFKQMCLQDGMSPPRAKIWYFMVRQFADPQADPANERPNVYAPPFIIAEYNYSSIEAP